MSHRVLIRGKASDTVLPQVLFKILFKIFLSLFRSASRPIKIPFKGSAIFLLFLMSHQLDDPSCFCQEESFCRIKNIGIENRMQFCNLRWIQMHRHQWWACGKFFAVYRSYILRQCIFIDALNIQLISSFQFEVTLRYLCRVRSKNFHYSLHHQRSTSAYQRRWTHDIGGNASAFCISPFQLVAIPVTTWSDVLKIDLELFIFRCVTYFSFSSIIAGCKPNCKNGVYLLACFLFLFLRASIFQGLTPVVFADRIGTDTQSGNGYGHREVIRLQILQNLFDVLAAWVFRDWNLQIPKNWLQEKLSSNAKLNRVLSNAAMRLFAGIFDRLHDGVRSSTCPINAKFFMLFDSFHCIIFSTGIPVCFQNILQYCFRWTRTCDRIRSSILSAGPGCQPSAHKQEQLWLPRLLHQ